MQNYVIFATLVGTATAGCTPGPIACYQDDVNGRVMGNPVKTGSMTQEFCAQLCSDAKKPMAGVEFSTQVTPAIAK